MCVCTCKQPYCLSVKGMQQGVLILFVMQLQVCSNRPSCRRRGTYLNSQSCQCEGTTPSTCRPGFNAVVDPHGFCSCESRTTPTCKPGFTIETYPCQCTIDVEPTCPTGSSITNEDARCTGTATPMCPRGATLHGCKCVKEYVRECAVGELSWDGW